MTNTLDILTIKASAKLDITEDAAQSALEEYIRQIEALESHTIDPDNINDEDADFLLEAIVQAQRSGDLGTQEIAALEALMPAVQDAQDHLGVMEQQRNTAICKALKAGARIKDIAGASGLSRQRIEQLRDTLCR